MSVFFIYTSSNDHYYYILYMPHISKFYIYLYEDVKVMMQRALGPSREVTKDTSCASEAGRSSVESVELWPPRAKVSMVMRRTTKLPGESYSTRVKRPFSRR